MLLSSQQARPPQAALEEAAPGGDLRIAVLDHTSPGAPGVLLRVAHHTYRASPSSGDSHAVSPGHRRRTGPASRAGSTAGGAGCSTRRALTGGTPQPGGLIPSARLHTVKLPGGVGVPVAGESFHADAINAVQWGGSPSSPLAGVLVPEPANAQDPHAVAV